MEVPIKGVVGVIGGSPSTVEAQLRLLDGPPNARPDALEIRADLFESPEAALQILEAIGRRFPAIFTVRLPGHGGGYSGDEAARLRLYRKALSCGAQLVDAEWQSECARALALEKVPLMVSQHDFEATPSDADLGRRARDMEAVQPRLIKIAGMARQAGDAIRMLRWVGQASASGPGRIGFAMGEQGVVSRVLSMAWGSPFTYGALGSAVAPGQASVHDLKVLYASADLTRAARVVGIADGSAAGALAVGFHNAAFRECGSNAVAVSFLLRSADEIRELFDWEPLAALALGVELQEEALAAARELKGAARAAGVSDLLVAKPDAAGGRSLFGANASAEGLLAALRKRRVHFKGLSAGVLGTGPAARAVAAVLKAEGAEPMLYSVDPEEDRSAADPLGVKLACLKDYPSARHWVLLNTLPWAPTGSGPPPLALEQIEADVLAVDLDVGGLEGCAPSPFLQAIESRGACALPPEELLAARLAAQLRLATGLHVAEAEAQRLLLASARQR